MKRMLAAAVAILMMVSLSMTAFSAEGNRFPFPQRTVRVVLSPFKNFSEIDENGAYRGIIIDYLNEIKKYTGWEVEYIFTDPEAAVQLLDSGGADLMAPMHKNPNTEKFYNFAELSSGYAYSTITTKAANTEYVPNDYDTFQGIRVAVFRKATARVAAFEQFCAANSLALTPVYFDDAQEWERAFAEGEVDAQLTSSAKLRDGEKIIASFKLEPYYFGVAKGSTGVLRELNHALEQMNQINPSFESDLYKKYFGENSSTNFTLTSAEKRFVREHPVLRIAAAPDWNPLSSFDSAGQLHGISADVIKIISEKTGFQLEYIPSESFQQSLTLLKNNQVDLLLGVPEGGLGEDGANLSFSLPYLPIQTVILHRSTCPLATLENPLMATVYGFDYSAIGHCKKQYYSSVDEAIEAVRKGKADFTVIDSLSAERYIASNGKSGLRLVPTTNVESKLSIALNNPANPTLLTILDRAIYSITRMQQQAIIFENTSAKSQITLKSFIYANPIQTILTIVSIGLLLLLLIFLIMNMRLRLSQKGALISDTYRIIGELSDEYIFAYDYETGKLNLPERFAALAGVNPVFGRADCKEEGPCQLLLAFEHSHQKKSFSVEFSGTLANGSSEMFRAICMVIYDSIGRPVRGIGKLVSIQAEVDEKMELEKKVNTDPLTGLYAKCYCEQWAAESLTFGEHGSHAALLLMDLDNFKSVNDTLGHLGGDAALKHFARTLETIFTEGEVLGRWGGDEFVVLLTSVANQAEVAAKAQALCTGMNHSFCYDNATVMLSISVGIALTDHTKDFREAFRAADNALYAVKRKSKNGYLFA
ncbi:MAG: transporter substrate-binding domain-containing protein [Angelakisella sp.]